MYDLNRLYYLDNQFSCEFMDACVDDVLIWSCRYGNDLDWFDSFSAYCAMSI